MSEAGSSGPTMGADGIRPAEAADVGLLGKLWFDGWRDAHAGLLPAALARHRTLASFTVRLAAALDEVRVMGPPQAPLGFAMLKGDELYQLFVAPAGRGRGVAAALIADAERVLAGRGTRTAWLDCAIGNDRAARFYEKCGWRRAGVVDSDLEVPGGTIPIKVWRYEKRLAAD
jgi:GNAT superfamily N-acetyltransferase